MVGKTITPKQLAQQWLTLPNRFEVNVFKFETLIGNAAKKIFKDSFYLRRFNSAGTFAWENRSDHKPHPILEETGTLKHSIVWDRFHSSNSRGIKILQTLTCSDSVKGNMEEISVMRLYTMKEDKLPNPALQHITLRKDNL